jgi:GDP-L-fucose synthase
VLWGTGNARREFLHVDDCAEACLFLMTHYREAEIVNVGAGADSTIAELAATIATQVGYHGEIHWDRSKPDGTLRKLLDSTRINALGWRPRIAFHEGLRSTYEWYAQHVASQGVGTGTP